ncbi:MAG TPA: FtsX-like permease family protein [Rectinemataceae bacterium]|nr:FtsX-like permease family protein [Rectinemataceae bacterium]
MILFRMAYGNLFLHKAKSILLGTIMCLGIAVLFVGNSLIDTAIGGLKKMFVEGYTGDVMVTGPTSFPTTIFGETAGGEEVIPHIAAFSSYTKQLSADRNVAATLPMLSGQVAMGLGEQVIGQGSAFGVDIADYRNFFSGNISLVEGQWPSGGDQAWIIISEMSAQMLSRAAGRKIGAGEKIVLSALGDTAGTVIREVEVAGIVKFNQSSQELAKISLVDADTMRDLLGFASLRDGQIVLTEKQAEFVEAFDPEALFSDEAGADVIADPGKEGVVSEESGFVDPFLSAVEAKDTATKNAPANDAAAEDAASGEGALSAPPEPAWQFILIRLVSGVKADRFMDGLKAFAAGLDQSVHVQDWVAGAGTVARTAVTIRLVFDLMVSIVAVIVIMITMNVLVVSISERVPEIGTLRALGAKKRFIRRMILLETSFLAIIAGLAGVFLGYLVLLVLRRSGIEAPNLFFEAIFAGKKLVPSISAGAALRAFLWIFGMSILSSLYPIAIALRIRPVVAMQGE